MKHVIVKEVTHPVHGPDGHALLFAPGEQFGEDHDLPPGVPWRLVIAEVPDEPEPAARPAAAKAEPAKAAVKPPGGKGT